MNFSENPVTTIIGAVFTINNEESKAMPLKESLSDTTKVGTDDLQITSAAKKRGWASPECRRLDIAHETASGLDDNFTEDPYNLGPHAS